MLRTAYDRVAGRVQHLARSFRSFPLSKVIGRVPEPTYNEINARDAASRLAIRNAKVLVVGANTGGDCREFIKLGAKEVHGLDVIDDVGSEFRHGRVTYHRQSIENTNLPSDSFDLVYSFATMEHVPDIVAGYTEMARLLKPGGVMYSMASPLWFSPYGHHMGCFQGHPWLHVVHDRQGILNYAKSHGIDGERGHSIEAIVNYMLDKTHFNMTPAREYREAILALENIGVMENSLLCEDASLLDHELGQRALALGYTADDLLSVTHRLIASK
jgi:SAM-dependent methyltransferase